eukprot:scaffold6343_cov191-Pinguiococcus_pyrenoidosus.AAC.1
MAFLQEDKRYHYLRLCVSGSDLEEVFRGADEGDIAEAWNQVTTFILYGETSTLDLRGRIKSTFLESNGSLSQYLIEQTRNLRKLREQEEARAVAEGRPTVNLVPESEKVEALLENILDPN